MNEQLSIDFARELGRQGREAATAGAEARSRGISDLMFAYLVAWARKCPPDERFTSEAITMAYATDPNFEQPKDKRSWGGVFIRAERRGILAIADYEGTRLMGHGVKGAKRYRSLICGKRATEVF